MIAIQVFPPEIVAQIKKRVLAEVAIALKPTAEFDAGFHAYFNRQGPGRGRIRSVGWLQARREEMAERAARWEERQSQF